MAQGNLKKRSEKFLVGSKGKAKASKSLAPRKGMLQVGSSIDSRRFV